MAAGQPAPLSHKWPHDRAQAQQVVPTWLNFSTLHRYQAVLSAYHTSDNILRISITCHAFSCTSPYAHRPRDNGVGQRQNMLQKVLELSSLVTFQIPG